MNERKRARSDSQNSNSPEIHRQNQSKRTQLESSHSSRRPSPPPPNSSSRDSMATRPSSEIPSYSSVTASKGSNSRENGRIPPKPVTSNNGTNEESKDGGSSPHMSMRALIVTQDASIIIGKGESLFRYVYKFPSTHMYASRRSYQRYT